MKADAKDLADSGKDLVEVRHADETLEHRDVRAVQRIQGETLPEYREQAGVAGGGMIERSREGNPAVV